MGLREGLRVLAEDWIINKMRPPPLTTPHLPAPHLDDFAEGPDGKAASTRTRLLLAKCLRAQPLKLRASAFKP